MDTFTFSKQLRDSWLVQRLRAAHCLYNSEFCIALLRHAA